MIITWPCECGWRTVARPEGARRHDRCCVPLALATLRAPWWRCLWARVLRLRRDKTTATEHQWG